MKDATKREVDFSVLTSLVQPKDQAIFIFFHFIFIRLKYTIKK